MLVEVTYSLVQKGHITKPEQVKGDYQNATHILGASKIRKEKLKKPAQQAPGVLTLKCK